MTTTTTTTTTTTVSVFLSAVLLLTCITKHIDATLQPETDCPGFDYFSGCFADECDYEPINSDLTYKFSLFWGRGKCKYKDGACCSLPPPPPNQPDQIVELPNRFTIHGLWAIQRDPSKVTTSPQAFNITLLDEDVISDMYENWPSVRHMTEIGAQNLWRHEWWAHGRKDPIFQVRFSEYYAYTIQLFKDRLSLESEKVLVSRRNTPADVRSLFPDDMAPLLKCTRNSTKHNFISELIFCMDSTVEEFIACSKEDSDCPEGEIFYYEPLM